MYWRSHPCEGRGNEDRTRLLAFAFAPAIALALALAQVIKGVPRTPYPYVSKVVTE